MMRALLPVAALLASGCLTVTAPEPAAPAPSEVEAPSPLLIVLQAGAWSDPVAMWLQASTPGGEPLLGEDMLGRQVSTRIGPAYGALEFTATWSGANTGFVMGYRLDEGDKVWLPPMEHGVPQRVAEEEGQHEGDGAVRWRFYWEPSSAYARGTGAMAGPGSYELRTEAVR